MTTNLQIIRDVMDRSRAHFVKKVPDEARGDLLRSDERMAKDLLGGLPENVAIEVINKWGSDFRAEVARVLIEGFAKEGKGK